MQDLYFYRLVILVNGLVPLALMAWDGAKHRLGANPLEFFMYTTGECSLIFLILTLSITPLRYLTGYHSLIKHRRLLGLLACFYTSSHFVAYAYFDKGLNIVKIGQDIWQRQYIAFGMLAFFFMIPLAITSTNGMIKRLGGQKWLKLHKAVYACAILGFLHYWLAVKVDTDRPNIYGLLLLILIGYRIFKQRIHQSQIRSLKISN